MKRSISAPLLLAVALFAGPGFAGANRESERIQTPISPARLVKMISAAKSLCFDLGYPDIVEDKQQQTLICKQDNVAMFLRFDNDGYFIKVDAFFNKMPVLGGLYSAPKKHRKKMIKALEAI